MTHDAHGNRTGGARVGVLSAAMGVAVTCLLIAAAPRLCLARAGDKAVDPDQVRKDEEEELNVVWMLDESLMQIRKKIEAAEAGKSKTSLTKKEVEEILGKAPEFSGHPGQIQTNSTYFEAYVWRTRRRQNFIAPPKKAEVLNMYAIYSGEVPPDKVKYRTKGFDKSQTTPPGVNDAFVVYVYYSAPKDATPLSREVVQTSRWKRLPYIDEVRKPPTAAELKKLHEANLAAAIAGFEKTLGREATQAERDAMDTWKSPPKKGNNSIPKQEN